MQVLFFYGTRDLLFFLKLVKVDFLHLMAFHIIQIDSL